MTTNDKLKSMIFQKLFIAFSDIVVELISHCDFDGNTRDVLSSNISNISKVLLEATTSSSTPAASPKRKVAKVTSKKSVTTTSSRASRSAAKKSLNQGQQLASIQESPVETLPTPTDDMEISELDSSENAEPTAEALEMELVALGRPKSLFLSGLPVATTEKAVKNHILKKVRDFPIDAVSISKLAAKGDYSSFVVNMGRDEKLFDALNSTEIWPSNTIVHEFKKGRSNHGFRRPRSN